MKNLLRITFSIFVITNLVSCLAYSDGYANNGYGNNGYGDPYYNNGNYYAPQGYYGGGGYYGNDGYYYRNDVNYYYDNGAPYYYGNNKRKVYVERRNSTATTSQRPNNGFPTNSNNNGGGFKNSGNNNGGFRNSNSGSTQNNSGGFRGTTPPTNNSNSGGFRNNSQTTQAPQITVTDLETTTARLTAIVVSETAATPIARQAIIAIVAVLETAQARRTVLHKQQLLQDKIVPEDLDKTIINNENEQPSLFVFHLNSINFANSFFSKKKYGFL